MWESRVRGQLDDHGQGSDQDDHGGDKALGAPTEGDERVPEHQEGPAREEEQQDAGTSQQPSVGPRLREARGQENQ